MKLDIRKDNEEEIDEIYFPDNKWISYDGTVHLEDECDTICIGDEVDVDNLIKASEKAKELWH